MISNKLYGYKLVYTNEPKVLTGNVSVSPIKWKGKAKIIKGRGSVAKGAGKAEPDFGKKLDYLFGKATGNQHNLERTAGMESELAKKMGITDTPENREYIMQKIRESYLDNSSISKVEQMSYVAKELPGKPTLNWTGTTRETFIMGPDRGAMLQTLWDDNVLKNIIVRGGKGVKPQTIEEILSQIKK
ncbi:hypothetical protein BD780_000819 [Clostridium tetanomorphum]|uniref:hypothetical protein n=1 Tax=Clostridium tetanomorphum TaxID=1553 RepID=UPI000D836260|nr:hypothetical protein [Clostridium tetanomorphum]MBP1863496.1 hypothetical protein [Clostridium tetanomorphum]NRS83594.1 hypothetical protein [Clostridium tetanomorphum]SQC01970.1 Uncharacterised protein [Clostridium tetanomorphum]